jgi:acetyltransferase-like isoleucine patch superfamily enzyme
VRARQLAKVGAFALSFVIVTPFIVLTWLEKIGTGTSTAFTTFSQLLSLLPDPFGSPLRTAYYVGTLDRCSWQVSIGFGSQFTHREAVLGPYVSLGRYCVIGHVVVEPGVRIASRVSIPSGRRQHLDASGRMASAADNFERVTIGTESWLGEGSIVLANVGCRCVVAAGAVVVHDVADGCVVGGNPAKDLRAREAKE